MSTKSILKRIICIGSLNFLILSAAMPAQAHYAQIEVGIEQACIKKSGIHWRYKHENGKLYRRKV